MQHFIILICALLIFLGNDTLVCAQRGDPEQVAIRITDTKGIPVEGVVVVSHTNDMRSAPTNRIGITSIYSYSFRDNICLKVARAPKGFVLVSPLDGCLPVEYGERPNLVLARRGDKSLLEHGPVLAGVLSKINSALLFSTDDPQSISKKRQAALAEQAGKYGFRPHVLDAAIKRWGMKTTDPYEKGLVALYESNYPRASEQLLVSLRARQADLEKSKEQLINATLSNGQSLYEKGDYRSAAQTFREALAISPQDPAILNKLGLALIKTRDYNGAEIVFKQALEISEKILGSEHQTIAEILNNLAELYYVQGRLAEAELLFKQGLVIYEKLLGPNSPRVAASLNSLAALYAGIGDLEKAEMQYNRALRILETSAGDKKTDTAFVLNNLGNLYLTKGQYLKAEELYRQALKLLDNSLGPKHPEVARALDNLGSLYYMKGEYDEAEILLKRALHIRERTSDFGSLDVALSLNNLALVSLAKRNYVEAESLFQRSIAIKERALRTDNPDVAYSLLNLARLYHLNGNYVKAIPLYNRALLVFEKTLGPVHPSIATASAGLAKLYADEGQYRVAEQLYERSLKIAEEALGQDHPEVASILEEYAATLQKMNRLNEASKLKERARLIRNKNGNGGAHDPEPFYVKIEEPARDGTEVGKEMNVKGMASIPKGSHLWVLARPIDLGDVWWPQGEATIDPNTHEWEIAVTFGVQADISREFEIAVIIVTEENHVVLQNYRKEAMRTGTWNPIKAPPSLYAPYIRKVKKVSHN
jgi:tetratricopeptide (TPR) repeat protein